MDILLELGFRISKLETPGVVARRDRLSDFSFVMNSSFSSGDGIETRVSGTIARAFVGFPIFSGSS